MILTSLLLGSGVVAGVPADDFAPLPASPALALTAAPQVDAPVPAEGDSDGWDGSFNVGASKTDGNTDVENYSVTLDAEKVVDIHRYNVFAGWYYTSTQGVRSQRRAIGSFKYDQFFAEKTYFWMNTFAETNEQALLDLRWSVGGGIGHQFRDDDEWKILAEVGLAYFDEEFDNGAGDSYLAARLAWDAEYAASETTTLVHKGELYPSLEDTDDVYGRADTYVNVMLSETMNARAQWVYSWDNTPAAGQKRADNLYLISVGWIF